MCACVHFRKALALVNQLMMEFSAAQWSGGRVSTLRPGGCGFHLSQVMPKTVGMVPIASAWHSVFGLGGFSYEYNVGWICVLE